jgi:prophage DNA circulation protein
MTWRDQLRPGSFRGVPFYWQEADADLGRNTVTHVFPLREKSYVEDMGKKPETFNLEVFVLGDDYMSKRDALARAFRQPGSGKLVHPTLGDMDVTVTTCRLSETSREGGIARFQLTFAESGDITFTRVETVDTQNGTIAASSTASTTAQNVFASRWTTTPKVASPLIAASAIQDINATLSNIKAQIGRLVAYDPLNAAGVLNDLANTRSLVGSLIQTPALVASRIGGIISELSFITSSPLGGVTSWLAQLGITRGGSGASTAGIQPNEFSGLYQQQLALATTGLPTSQSGLYPSAFQTALAMVSTVQPEQQLPVAYQNIFGSTPAALTQIANQAYLQALVRQAALAEAAQMTTVWPFDTADQATSIRDELASRIDYEMMIEIDDGLYNALAAMRLAVITDLTTRAASLPSTVSITLIAPTPALVLAHRLYDDPGLDADIIARNDVRNPNFVPAGVALQVLNANA